MAMQSLPPPRGKVSRGSVLLSGHLQGLHRLQYSHYHPKEDHLYFAMLVGQSFILIYSNSLHSQMVGWRYSITKTDTGGFSLIVTSCKCQDVLSGTAMGKTNTSNVGTMHQ